MKFCNKGYMVALETHVSNDSNRANAISQQQMYSVKCTKGALMGNLSVFSSTGYIQC